MNNQNECYNISRDRIAELRAANVDSTDSTEAFGPRRNYNYRRVSKTEELLNSSSPTPTTEGSQHNTSSQRTAPIVVQDEKVQVVDLNSMNEFLEEIDSISAAIREVNHSIDDIGKLHDLSLDNFSDRETKRLDVSIDNVFQQNQEIKQRIKALDPYCHSGADVKIRQTQSNRVRQEFVQVIHKILI